ncbi:MAG: 2,3-epoxybenzoyl-CoA dihydrolase [Proteobacteria bacterium]|nr:2,3-epoxybenzoyl-CoA dihydrolase [Pseudomonadota bacterium]
MTAQPSHQETESSQAQTVFFDTHPTLYRHWSLSVSESTATLHMDVNEDAGLKPGYKLKLNSYDLGVDIELYDAINRIRFEHPNVKCVVITSAKEKMFCSGANIYMLGQSTYSWKVNFCKFTNETRNGIEDSSRYDGLKFIASINGTVAGGGYELALACDKLLMIDDRSSSVSLPEVPLLGVLPGTGGLTRVIDKRKVRRDLADVFCSTTEGVRADRAQAWGLVDVIAKPNDFSAVEKNIVKELSSKSSRPEGATGVGLTQLKRTIDSAGMHYSTVDIAINRSARTATIVINVPSTITGESLESIHQQGCDWWPLTFARELDDGILLLRTNELEIGTWIFRTVGNCSDVLKMDAIILEYQEDWFVKETIGYLRRTLARLDVSSRTMFALIGEGSCFAGTLFEIALAADRIFMLSETEDGEHPTIGLSKLNFGSFPMINHLSRLQNRFYGHDHQLQEVTSLEGKLLDAEEALNIGLVTYTPDDIDWDDELRLAIEERNSLSPDALTGMEANLRFSGPETMETRIFTRLSAWQNWIFIRPNAVGDQGALKLYGSGKKPDFNWQRI